MNAAIFRFFFYFS
ncbi:pheST operon leader peptide PheM, partial [Escherichia coli]